MRLVDRRTYFRKTLELLAARPGYVWGGKALPGLDCSGFVTLALKLSGGPDWTQTHNTDALWRLPSVQAADVQPGDLVLYYGKSSRGPSDVSHVMTCVGFGFCAGMAWGGPGDTDASTSRLEGKVAMVREIAYRADLAGFVRLPLT
jgi:hypothetical protein